MSGKQEGMFEQQNNAQGGSSSPKRSFDLVKRQAAGESDPSRLLKDVDLEQIRRLPDVKPSRKGKVKDAYNKVVDKTPLASRLKLEDSRANEVNKLTSDFSNAIFEICRDREQLTALPSKLRGDFIKVVQSLPDLFVNTRGQALEGYNQDKGAGRRDRDRHLASLKELNDIAASMVERLQHWRDICQSEQEIPAVFDDVLHPEARSFANGLVSKVIDTATEDDRRILRLYRERLPRPPDTSAILSQSRTWLQDLPRRLKESCDQHLRGEEKDVDERTVRLGDEDMEHVLHKVNEAKNSKADKLIKGAMGILTRRSQLEGFRTQYWDTVNRPGVTRRQKRDAYLHWYRQVYQTDKSTSVSVENARNAADISKITAGIYDAFEVFGKKPPNDMLNQEYKEIASLKRSYDKISAKIYSPYFRDRIGIDDFKRWRNESGII